MFNTTIAHADRARLHELAKAEALRLRRAAMDDFWRGTNLWLDTALGRSQRSAQRLADRIARRRLGAR
jgi:hypothetical protein